MKQIVSKYKIWAAITGLIYLGSCSDDPVTVVNIAAKEASYSSTYERMTITLKDNETVQLNVHTQPLNAENQEVSYSITGNYATVNGDGLITPKGIGILGQDTLTISSLDGAASVSYVVDVVTHIVLVTSITVTSDWVEPTFEVGTIKDLSSAVTVSPNNATNGTVTYTSSDPSVVTIDENTGELVCQSAGEAAITIAATDDSGVSATIHVTVVDKVTGDVDLDRSAWQVVQISHDRPADAAITNAENSAIDGDETTCLSLVKPGKSYGGITVGADEKVFFILDLGEEQEFSYFRILHRTSNTNTYLRVHGISILGSNDGENFTMIAENVSIPNVTVPTSTDSGDITIPVSAYRYVKVVYTDWDTSSGSTMQMAEFYLGLAIE